mmetsp:Transcript_39274/g.79325  ORF Transcript_39274/g.79325 Transcript_39274/m.79325 type:complete len:440 (+) Transcript_39274:250-1569(+)
MLLAKNDDKEGTSIESESISSTVSQSERLSSPRAHMDLIKELQAEISFYAKLGLLDHNGSKLHRLAPLVYSASTVAYWRGYSIYLASSIVASVALFVVIMAWTSLASTSWSVGMNLLLKYFDMLHSNGGFEKSSKQNRRSSLLDVAIVGGEEISDENMGLVTAGHGPATSRVSEADLQDSKLISVLHRSRRGFYNSCIGNFVLMSIWCSVNAASSEAGSFEQIASIIAIPLGTIAYVPVVAQFTLSNCVLEVTSVLVSADVDSFRDDVMSSFLDPGLETSQRVAKVDYALNGIRKRAILLNKTWGSSVFYFLCSLLLLEAVYLIVAFGAPGDVRWYGRACLVVLALVPISSMCLVLTFMAAPADRWSQIFALDFSTGRMVFEGQRIFGDAVSIHGILREQRLGFVVMGTEISTGTVFGAAATATLGLLLCLVEVQAGAA